MTLAMSQLFLGQIATLHRTFAEEDITACMNLTRDHNSVYTQQKLANNTHFSGPIVPGLLTEGLITEVITTKLPGTAAVLLQKEIVFCNPVYKGDTVTAELEIIDIDYERNWITTKVSCYNQLGKEVVKGQVVIWVVSEINE